jgi:hypothetical protein
MKRVLQALDLAATQGATCISTKGVSVFTYENSGNSVMCVSWQEENGNTNPARHTGAKNGANQNLRQGTNYSVVPLESCYFGG